MTLFPVWGLESSGFRSPSLLQVVMDCRVRIDCIVQMLLWLVMGITNSMNMNFSKLQEIVKDREA